MADPPNLPVNHVNNVGEVVNATDIDDIARSLNQLAELKVNKNTANGYAGLGAGGLVAIAQLASGTPTGSKFLRDDNTLAVPAGGGSVTPSAVGFYNLLNYGGVADAVEVTDASITGGTATITSATAGFTSTAVDGGKLVRIKGAGTLQTAATTCTAASNASGTTAVFTIPNQLTVGEKVTVAGFTPAGYNGTWTVTAVTAPCTDATNNTAFSATIGSSGLGAASVLGTIQWAAPWSGTISTVTNATTAVLSGNVTTTVAGGYMVFGTNNATAIGSLLAAAGTSTNSYIPTGKYMIGSSISLAGHHLIGPGKSQVTLIAKDSSFNMVTLGSLSRVTGIGFRGPGFRDTTFAKVFNGGNTLGAILEDCLVEQAAGQGISLADNSPFCIIRFCTIRNNGDEGLYWGLAGDDINVHHNEFVANWKTGIDFGGKNVVISFNRFRWPGVAQDGADNEAILGNGTHLSQPREVSGCEIIGNLVEGGYTGIRLTIEGSVGGLCFDNLVAFNTIRDTQFQGLDLTVNTTRNQVLGNRIVNTGGFAITVNTTADNLIEANYIENCPNGILVYNGSTGNTITGNKIKNNAGYGIRLDYIIDQNNVVTNNTLTGNGSAIQDATGASSGNYIARNRGWNPLGPSVTQVPAPASGNAQTNTTPYDATFYFLATSGMTSLALDGTTVWSNVSLTSGSFRVPSGHTFTPTYAGSLNLTTIGE